MNRAVIFIFITLLIDITGIGLILPVLPDLIRELEGVNVSNASVIGGWLLFAYAMPQFVFAPILGALSDRFGRRPVLLFSLFGFGIDNLIMGFAPTIFWLFIGRIFAGICGASISTAAAYIADVSKPEERAANFGMIGAAFGLGFILGPLIGGVLGEYGTRLPFFAAAALCFINVAFGYFVLPESLSEDKRRAFELKRANPFGTLKNISKNPIVIGLALAYLLSEIAHHAYQSTWTFYTIELFDFSTGMIGLSLGVFGLLYAVVNGWLIRVIIPKVGEINTVWIGLFFTFFAFIAFGFLTENWLLWAMLVPAALGGFLDPGMQGIMANETEDNAQGELQGAISSLTSIAAIIGPVLMTQLFARFTDAGREAALYAPGAPFLAAALLMIIAMVPIFLSVRRYAKKKALGLNAP
ncbi:MAG: TCR/Tet family MFS transporter [Pseudomonadota bacterium]